jgi:hypothetical protein
MRIKAQKLKFMFKSGVFLGISALSVFMVLGCASTHKTTQTETVVTSSEQVVTSQGKEGQTTIVTTSPTVESSQTTNTTTATETKPTGHPGILSSTVHAIGWVIALPFRLVGGLIGWIF